MELPLKCPAMTLFLFQILVLCYEVLYILVPDAGQVAKNLKTSQFYCGAMRENFLYALNQVRQYHITPEELEISQTKSIFTLSTSEKNLMQRNVGYSIEEKSGNAEMTTTVALIKL